jgi:hypothetical protein
MEQTIHDIVVAVAGAVAGSVIVAVLASLWVGLTDYGRKFWANLGKVQLEKREGIERIIKGEALEVKKLAIVTGIALGVALGALGAAFFFRGNEIFVGPRAEVENGTAKPTCPTGKAIAAYCQVDKGTADLQTYGVSDAATGATLYLGRYQAGPKRWV